jgi:tRNA (mo5U34)-methyltransferase
MPKQTLQSQLVNPRTDREREIAEMGPWFHNLHLPDGTQTAPDHPLGDFPTFKWQQIAPHIPGNLSGWRVLDIGCNAGFYSFELAKRGAQVKAIDVNPHYLRQAQWAARQFELEDRIEFAQMQVYQLAQLDQSYDLVWFMGVLYHLRYPLLALDIVSRKARRLMVVQSLTLNEKGAATETTDLTFNDIDRMQHPGWPKMAFVEHDLEGDETNWWLPNEACLEAMLRTCGMRTMARPADQIYVCQPIANSDAVRAHTQELRAATGRL